MSEYKPITGELRNSMTYDITTAPDGVNTASIGIAEFNDLCDAIDSIHAALEAENERLREQADKQTVGELFVRVHLDYSDMAQQLEWAAQAVRNIGGDAE